MRTLDERFNDNWVDTLVGCWTWTAGRSGSGYGAFSPTGRGSTQGAHRWIYERINGPVPDGLVIDHLCRVRHCVNPSHLEAVSQLTNTHRGKGPAAINAVKTHCLNGHEFNKENTATYGTRRQCRKCKSIRGAARYLKKK